MISIVEQNERFDLRIDNQSFSNLYLTEKTKENFKYEDTKKDFPSTSDNQRNEEVKKPMVVFKEEKEPVKKQVNLLDAFDEPIKDEVKEEPKPRTNEGKSSKAPVDLFDLNFDQPESSEAKGMPSFGSSKASFGSNKMGERKKDDFFSSDFQF